MRKGELAKKYYNSRFQLYKAYLSEKNVQQN